MSLRFDPPAPPNNNRSLGRRREPKVGTLADHITQGNDIAPWCRVCRHHGDVIPYEGLVERFGPDTSSEALCRALRCTACGAKDADFNVSQRSNRRIGMSRAMPTDPTKW